MPTLDATPDSRPEVALHYEDTGGEGRPVVLIHGWPLSGAAWKDTVPALQQAGYRVITYDRRGFGDSDKPLTGYSYDHLSDDLAGLLERLDLTDVTLVGFSMGGGEVARYVAREGESRLRSVVFASAVPPFMHQTGDNPDGPLSTGLATKMTAGLTANQASFYDDFITQFFTAGDRLMVTEEQRQEALALTDKAAKPAALECMAAFGFTDFRDDLTRVTVPTLVIHGDSDATVPFEGSGARTHAAIPGSRLHVVEDGPHGINVSHAEEFNRVLVDFLGPDGSGAASA
ncbi:MAG: alpha/beta hydrolase [Lapillicoccus sp.]